MPRSTDAFEQLAHKRAVARKCSRRYRQRRRNGIKTLRIEISSWAATLDAFVKAGVLGEQQRTDRAAIEVAIARLCREGYRALMAAQTNAAAPRPAATD